MHFNTKYIFQGDNKTEIGGKINYNFDQILSFAVGPNGHQGEKGPTGIPGPAGKKGFTGSNGIRANLWVTSIIQPSSASSIEYDKWVDQSTSDYQIKEYSATGSWNYTGYSLFSSNFFRSYSGVSGPAGVTDRFAIGLSNTGILSPYNESGTNLVISDATPSDSNSNPNNSKLLVVINDQTSIPIFSFVKSTNVVSGAPSFYWSSTGSSLKLKFLSSYNFTINSLLGITIDSATSRTLLTGNSMNISAPSGFYINHPGDFFFNSNTTVGSGNFFSVSSRNFRLGSSSLTSIAPFRITSSSAGFAFSTDKYPVSAGTSFGLEIQTTNSSLYQFQFLDSNSATIFGAMPSGNLTGQYSQTFFGSTGGLTPGGTAGPYFYKVQKFREIRSSNYSTQSCVSYGSPILFSGSNLSTPRQSISPVLDITPIQNWDTNYIIVTPGSTGPSVYLYVPTILEPTPPLFYRDQNNTYRIFINDISPVASLHIPPNSDSKIFGIVWDYYHFTSSSSTTPVVVKMFMNFPISRDTTAGAYTGFGCSYIDLTYSYITSSTNANPIILWKTCTGSAGFINITNKYAVGSTTPPPRATTLPPRFVGFLSGPVVFTGNFTLE